MNLVKIIRSSLEYFKKSEGKEPTKILLGLDLTTELSKEEFEEGVASFFNGEDLNYYIDKIPVIVSDSIHGYLIN